MNAQGVLVMHGPHSDRIDAQIDGRGTVTGRATGDCSYQHGLAEGGQVNLIRRAGAR